MAARGLLQGNMHTPRRPAARPHAKHGPFKNKCQFLTLLGVPGTKAMTRLMRKGSRRAQRLTCNRLQELLGMGCLPCNQVLMCHEGGEVLQEPACRDLATLVQLVCRRQQLKRDTGMQYLRLLNLRGNQILTSDLLQQVLGLALKIPP